MLQKIYIFIQRIFYFLFTKDTWKNVSPFPLKYSTLIIIKKMFLEQKISILKGSCDTEDWINGCWKIRFAITGINYILKYIKMEIFHNIYYIFDQIDASLVSIRDFFQTLTFPKCLNGW